MAAEELTATGPAGLLAGTAWRPDVPPHAAALLFPGSGPSDRYGDEYFEASRVAYPRHRPGGLSLSVLADCGHLLCDDAGVLDPAVVAAVVGAAGRRR